MSCDSRKKENFIFNKATNRSVDNIAYALGVQYGHSSREFMFDDSSHTLFIKGLNEGRKLKALPNDDIIKQARKIDTFVSLYRKKVAQKNKTIGKKKIESLLISDTSLIKHRSGLIYKILKQGTPINDIAKESKIFMKYSISSFNRDQIIEDNLSKETSFPYQGMLKAWKISLNICGEGCEIVVYSPSSLAYGNEGSRPVIQPGEYLKFKLIFSSISSL
jgi:FKBP-type peptidyl-prolyl cis-trans isomerase